jgi:cytochrome P450
MYAELLNPEASKGHPPATALHLCHEALALYAAGSHPVAVTLMTGVYYLLRDPEAKRRLVDEVNTAWPVLDDRAPGYEDLEKLPFLASLFICLIEFELTTEQTDGGG